MLQTPNLTPVVVFLFVCLFALFETVIFQVSNDSGADLDKLAAQKDERAHFSIKTQFETGAMSLRLGVKTMISPVTYDIRDQAHKRVSKWTAQGVFYTNVIIDYFLWLRLSLKLKKQSNP